MDGVKDHLILHLLGNTTSRDMWKSLKCLFLIKNENHKMVLRENLRNKMMTGSNMVTTYFTLIRIV
jgi:hypothetical protein